MWLTELIEYRTSSSMAVLPQADWVVLTRWLGSGIKVSVHGVEARVVGELLQISPVGNDELVTFVYAEMDTRQVRREIAQAPRVGRSPGSEKAVKLTEQPDVDEYMRVGTRWVSRANFVYPTKEEAERAVADQTQGWWVSVTGATYQGRYANPDPARQRAYGDEWRILMEVYSELQHELGDP